MSEKNILKVDEADEFYCIDAILKKSGVENKKNDIIKRLENNYNNSLIEDDEYKPILDDKIKNNYLSKFALFSINLNRNINYNDIQALLERLKSLEENNQNNIHQINKEPKKNMVTIFVSGFLTADKNSFSEEFKNYSFKEMEKVIIIFIYDLRGHKISIKILLK